MLGVIETVKPPKRDVYQRAKLFDPRSFTHHAKFNLNLVQAIVDRYSDPGDLVVDPMGGTGSIYVAGITGRRVAAGDIELQWARLLRDNAALMATRSFFALSMLAAQWDAANLPIASGRVDLIVSSPPYFDVFSDWDIKSNYLVNDDKLNEHGIAYGVHPQQIANIHIYENYLRMMRSIYAEAKRVLRPGGKLVLVLKNVIRGGRTVPVVDDNVSLVMAVGGFRLIERFDVPARGTQFRNIQQVKLGQAAPESEPVLVFEKSDNHRAKQRLALLELPRLGDGPGWIIASKAFNHARDRSFEVWSRSPDESEFHPTSDETGFGLVTNSRPGQTFGFGEDGFNGLVGIPSDQSEFHPPADETVSDPVTETKSHLKKARARREFAFQLVRELLVKADLVAGDEIWFYGSERYGQYICRRLKTLGCTVTKPLEGLNNGQRLRWLTSQNNPCEGSEPSQG